ncbi:hypothetical protein J4E85_010004 [Alternaria conjuncta]|uniref:uncharacterized protein n=1 Tax=Alternaria conjuncta TaxID=181017 RepID=UPI00222087BA|nr:uncharacterized protein J4E85_010004 [Alternaria conjuncta]KAI4917485.1 hypothetical protein J4E85_010004 [Alternaria conjuncta]
MLYTVEPRQTVHLGLMITCRIAHEELKHIVFRKLQFKTHHSYDEDLSYMGVRSRAGRFKCMLRLVERQKRRMLIKVFELLQPDDLHELYTRFPTVKRWFDIPLRQSVVEQVDKLEATEGFSGDEEDHELSESAFAHALQYALVCAKDRNRADFVRLTRGLFGVGQCPIDWAANYTQSNIFVEGALYDVYSWNPEPWSLPDDAELAKLEALLCVPGDTDTQLPINDEGTFYFPDLNTHIKAAKERWFFSAASIAIDFCESQMTRLERILRTLADFYSETNVTREKAQHAHDSAQRRLQSSVSI